MSDEDVLQTGNDDLDKGLYHLRQAAIYFVFAGWASEDVAQKARRYHEVLFYHMDSVMHKAEAEELSEEERGPRLAAAVAEACKQMANEDFQDPVIQRSIAEETEEQE